MSWLYRRTFLTASMAASASLFLRGAESSDADVVVYGATPAGVLAAVAAARAGAKTVLIEPENFVGGIMSAGLGFSDSNQTDRRTLKGLFEETHLRIAKHYAQQGTTLKYDVLTKDQTHWVYECKVAERIFNEMLAEAKVSVRTGRELKSVAKKGPVLESISLDNGDTISARSFVDATYEGDLLAAAGVSWTLGREGRAEYNESLAGAIYPKKRMNVDPYGPDGKLLPLMNEGAPPEPGTGDKRIMTYSFRLALSSDPNNRTPFPIPQNYKPETFELARRLLRAEKVDRFVDIYPLPNNKADGNNGIHLQLSLGLVGRCAEYPLLDRAGRRKIYDEHVDYTFGLIHFLLSDPEVPEKMKSQLARYGLAKDEFTATRNIPPMLYVREGRRMKGQYFFTQKDVLEDVTKPDAAAIGSFPIDSHDCQRVADGKGGFINEGTIFPKRLKSGFGQPHQIPYRALLPKVEEAANLIVPVALSCSHVALSSIRVEPTWMALGQSAGVAAALAAQERKGFSDLKVETLKERWVAAGQVLDLPADVRPKM